MLAATQRRGRLPPTLYLVAIALLGMMGAAFLVQWIVDRTAAAQARTDIRLMDLGFQNDLLAFVSRFKDFHSPAFFTHTRVMFMYPAPTAVAYQTFYLLPHTGAVFLLFTVVAFLLGSLQFSKALVLRGIAVGEAYVFPLCILLCSYPFWLEIKQGNMEIVVWVLLTTGLGCFLRRRDYSAAACFAIAGAMKIYPFLYFGLLLQRRRYRQILFGVAVLGVTTLLSLWLVCPNLKASQDGIKNGLATFRTYYMLMLRPEMKDDHSLFGFFKMHAHPLPGVATMSHLLSAYLGTVALLGGLLFLVRIRRLPLLNQILCLTIAIVLLPPTSFEYTLLHLFLPFAMLVVVVADARRERHRVPGAALMLACFVLLFSFLPEFVYRGEHYSGQIKCLTLLTLFFFALWKPLTMSLPVEHGEAVPTWDAVQGR